MRIDSSHQVPLCFPGSPAVPGRFTDAFCHSSIRRIFSTWSICRRDGAVRWQSTDCEFRRMSVPAMPKQGQLASTPHLAFARQLMELTTAPGLSGIPPQAWAGTVCFTRMPAFHLLLSRTGQVTRYSRLKSKPGAPIIATFLLHQQRSPATLLPYLL